MVAGCYTGHLEPCRQSESFLLFLLTPATTERYFRDRGELAVNETVRVTELSGGVSNEVLLVERSRGDRFVLKQAREQLRVEQEWKCDVRRIWREMDVLRLCGEVLETARDRPGLENTNVPGILFEDRQNYCYSMTAAPHGHQTWKQRLLTGDLSRETAVTAGRLLGQLHGGTWNDPWVASALADRSHFDALRIDPYYRRIAQVHPSLKEQVEALIDSVWSHQTCLTHGDFSPKNLLVSDGTMTLIDFEVGHYGDPAFDVGFCLTHLALKSIWAGQRCSDYLKLAGEFWYAYALRVGFLVDDCGDLQQRCVANLAGCLLARIDGKSPVDYLNEQQSQRVRELAMSLLRRSPASISDVLGMVEAVGTL